MDLAPVVLFTFNRPILTQKTLDALAKNILADQTVLYIYCDGAKKDMTNDQLHSIENLRKVVKNEKRFLKVSVIERSENMGLAKSIIAGVTEIVNSHGQIIVLEDDIITSLYFLQYMNQALSLYKNEQRVLSISTCNFFALDSDTPPTFLTAMPDCLGWATWKNRWELFEPSSQKLLDELEQKNLMHRFNLDGAYNFKRMLVNQAAGKVSSWAVRWHAVGILNNMLSLYPNPALTNHISGESATNALFDILPPLATAPIEVKLLPIVELSDIRKKLKKGHSYYDNRWVKLWFNFSGKWLKFKKRFE